MHTIIQHQAKKKGGTFQAVKWWIVKVKVKVKQSYYRTGPEGSRRLKLPDFMTFGTRRW
jgi:hypothetical protein